MAHDEKHKQGLECQGWNHAEIDCRDRVRMVAQECPPSLRWRPSVLDYVSLAVLFCDFERGGRVAPGRVTVPLCSRTNASPFWIMLLLVWGRLDNGMIPFWQPEGVALGRPSAYPRPTSSGEQALLRADAASKKKFFDRPVSESKRTDRPWLE
jgi:hypothetical protein